MVSTDNAFKYKYQTNKQKADVFSFSFKITKKRNKIELKNQKRVQVNHYSFLLFVERIDINLAPPTLNELNNKFLCCFLHFLTLGVCSIKSRLDNFNNLSFYIFLCLCVILFSFSIISAPKVQCDHSLEIKYLSFFVYTKFNSIQN